MLVDEDQHDEKKNNAIASKILNLFGAKDDGSNDIKSSKDFDSKKDTKEDKKKEEKEKTDAGRKQY